MAWRTGFTPNQLLEHDTEWILTLDAVIREADEQQAKANRGR